MINWQYIDGLKERRGLDVMLVCERGHWITSEFFANPRSRKRHCDKCGAKAVGACPECEEPIRGNDHNTPESRRTFPPHHCEHCGGEFPWTRALEAERQAAVADATLSRVERLCSRFHRVACQLRTRHDNRPTISVENEYDVQDLMHALLRIDFDDIREEQWTPSYAGGSSRIDFILKTEQIVIEIKMARKNLTSRHLGEQLIVDIEKYSKHPDCKRLVCFVYDPVELISNPIGIKNDLEQKSIDALPVRVFIFPR